MVSEQERIGIVNKYAVSTSNFVMFAAKKKKKVGVVILKGSKGSWVYTYVYI